jgi:dUTP pyrophosphatase
MSDRLTPVVRVRRVDPHATLPRYAHPGDAGLDLAAVVRAGILFWSPGHEKPMPLCGLPPDKDGECVLCPNESVRVPTGWAFEIPDGFEGQVRPRSSTTQRRLHVALATIDSGYRGEVFFHLHNLSGHQQTLRTGDRLAQMVVAPVARAEVVEAEALSDSSRGERGHGSTGR